MTVIEITQSPPNSKKADPEERVPPPVRSPPPDKWKEKKVAFQGVIPTDGPPTDEERILCRRVVEILPPFSEDAILKILRRIPAARRKNDDDVVSEIVESLLLNNASEEENQRPVQGCAERPSQMDSSEMPQLESAATFPGPLAPHRIPLAPAAPAFVSSGTSTSNEQSDLQQAIQLSLQSSKQQHLPAIAENPEEMQRTESAVGILNVGQTCWFNVIVQALFHIPKYRQRLYYDFPEEWLNASKETLSPAARFLVELRKLFALMEAGSKRAVDPTDTIRALEAVCGSPLLGHQNDASEMKDRVTGVITRALREAFDSRTRIPLQAGLPALSMVPSSSTEQMDVSPAITNSTVEDEKMHIDGLVSDGFAVPAPPPKPCHPSKEDVWSESPFSELFHHKRVQRRVHLASGSLEFGAPMMSDTPTITCNVQEPSLHEAIEHHFTNDIDETYLETLPEVFFVSLNRFCYRNGMGTSKIHTELSIPQTIFMDRYLHRNYGLVKGLHMTRDKLRHELAEYTARCNGWEKFPITNGFAPLLQILNATKLYIGQETAHFRRPDLLLPTPQLAVTQEQEREFMSLLEKYCTEATYSRQQCFDKREKLLEELTELFEVDSLQKEEYTLHSVIIHEGEADRGHYWSYVRCDPNSENRNLWQKFNDAGVDIVTWQQVAQEAKGNMEERRDVSAYALCYVKSAASNLLSDSCENVDDRIKALPRDMQEFIERFNIDYWREVEQFKESIEPSWVMEAEPIMLERANYTILDDHEKIMCQLDAPREPLFSVYIPLELFDESTREVSEAAQWCRQPRHKEDQDWDFNLSMLMQLRLKAIIKEKYSSVYQDDITLMMQGMHETEQEQLYETVIQGIYEAFHSPKEDPVLRRDFRSDPVTWWFSTGLGMSSFAFRFIVVKALSGCNYKPLVEIAARELARRNTNEVHSENWHIFNLFYARFHSLYCLLKQLATVTRITLFDCMQNQKFDEDTVNDYFAHWLRTLMSGYLVDRVYNELAKGLTTYAQQINRSIDPSEVTVNRKHVNVTIIYPFLKLWRYVIYCILQSRGNPTAINPIAESNNFNILTATLNFIAQQAKSGDPLCEKISESAKTALDMCSNLIEESSPARTTIENFAHSLKPEVPVSFTSNFHREFFAPSVEHELHDMARLRIELGFADEQDSIETVARLLGEGTHNLITAVWS